MQKLHHAYGSTTNADIIISGHDIILLVAMCSGVLSCSFSQLHTSLFQNNYFRPFKNTLDGYHTVSEMFYVLKIKNKETSVASVRKPTIPTELPPLVSEVRAK
jgi:hypothetical protein